MLASGVEDAADDDGLAVDAEKDFVRERVGQHAAKALVINGKLERRFFEPGEGFGDGEKELVAQSGALVFVPIAGLLQVGIGGGECGNLPDHADLAARRRCRASAPGRAGVGIALEFGPRVVENLLFPGGGDGAVEEVVVQQLAEALRT